MLEEVAEHQDIRHLTEFALAELDRGKLPFFRIGAEIRCKFLCFSITVCGCNIVEHRPKPELAIGCVFIGRQAVAHGPAGQGKGLPGLFIHVHHDLLPHIALLIYTARQPQGGALVDGCCLHCYGRAVLHCPSIQIALKAAVFQHIICSGVGILFQLRGIHTDHAFAVYKDLYIHALCSFQFKGHCQPHMLRFCSTELLADTQDIAGGIRHAQICANIHAAIKGAGNTHVCREGILTRRQRIGLLENSVFKVVRIATCDQKRLPAKSQIRAIGENAYRCIAVTGHFLPISQDICILKAMIFQEVPAIAGIFHTTVHQQRVDADAFRLCAHSSGILGIGVPTEDIAVLVKGIGSVNVARRCLSGLAVCGLCSRDDSSAGSQGISIGRAIAGNKGAVLHAVLCYAGKTASGVGICYLIEVIAACILQSHRNRPIGAIGDNCLSAVRINNRRKSVAAIEVADACTVRRGDGGEETVAIGKVKESACTVSNFGNPVACIKDFHCVGVVLITHLICRYDPV